MTTAAHEQVRRMAQGEPLQGRLRNGVEWRFWHHRFQVRLLRRWFDRPVRLLTRLG